MDEERHERHQHRHDDVLGVLGAQTRLVLLGAWLAPPLAPALHLALEALVLGLLTLLLLLPARALRLLFLLGGKYARTDLFDSNIMHCSTNVVY